MVENQRKRYRLSYLDNAIFQPSKLEQVLEIFELTTERNFHFQFTIIAEDVDGQSDFTVVYVTIINTNDNVPELNIPESVYLQQNYDISQPVLNITATVSI